MERYEGKKSDFTWALAVAVLILTIFVSLLHMEVYRLTKTLKSIQDNIAVLEYATPVSPYDAMGVIVKKGR